MKSQILRPCLALILPALLAAFPARGGEGTLTPEMVVDLAHVTDVALAPDGNAVAYALDVQRAADDEPGRSYSEIWLAPTGGGEPRRFTRGKERATAPAFSSDGKTLSFQVERKSDQDGVQIYALPLDGGEARCLSAHRGSVESHRWSPDGKWIAYAAKDADPEPQKKDVEAGRDWQVEGEELKFRHLWLLEVESGQSHRVYDADLDVNRILWTPDGRSIVFQANPSARVDDEYMATGIYTVPAQGDARTPRILVATEGKLGDMALAPDGGHLAYLGASSLNDPLAQSLFVVPASGGSPRHLTQGYAGSAAHLAWPEGGFVLMLAVEGEQQALYRVDPASGERTAVFPLAAPEGAANVFPHLVVGHLDAGAGRLALAASSPGHPAELFASGPNGGGPRRLSDHNPRLRDVRLARQEAVGWKGAGGWPIGGVLTYPLDYEPGKRYPLVLQVHGGPEGVSLDGWTTSASYPVQLLAADGFMVLQPNYRGSAGRGVAFSKADHDDLGGKEFDDVLAGVDALIERGMVDPGRVGTGGWSYGGYLSAWAATRWSERFQASVVAAGLTNWISFAGTTDIPNEMSIVHWNSWWSDQPELHWQRSPMAYLKGAKTPTLVVTGAEDKRVNPEQARQLYTGLRLAGVPTEMVFYPREPHGLRERAHQLDFIARTRGWFGEHLQVPKVEKMEERQD